MTNRRSDNAQNSIEALKALVFTGNLREWVAGIVAIAVPLILGLQVMEAVSSLVSDIIIPILFSPLIAAIGINSLVDWTIGNARVGSFLAALINLIVFAIVLFILTRILRRWLS